MDVTIISPVGLLVMCETAGCPNKATSVWSATVIAGGAPGTQHYACDQHNPMHVTALPLPPGFTTQPLCHTCGQPRRFP